MMPHRAGLLFPMMLLAAAGIALILLAGSLGAATSGRGLLGHWFGSSGPGRDTAMRTSELPKILEGSGA